MPKWTIEGADKNTGADRTMTIDAATEVEATAQAAAAEMLVSSIRLAPTDEFKPLQYASGQQSAAVPTYKKITEGSKTLNAIGWTIGIFGWGLVAFGLLLLIVMFLPIERGLGLLANLAEIIPAMMSGISLLIIAALIRMIAAIALAIRDMAINSFEQR